MTYSRRCVGYQWDRYAGMQVCGYAGMQVCRYAEKKWNVQEYTCGFGRGEGW